MTLQQLIHQWLEADAQQKKGSKLESDSKKKKEQLQEPILELFTQAGISNMTINGRNVYTHDATYISAKKIFNPATDTEEIPWHHVTEVLIDCGFSDYVENRCDSKRVAKLIRDIMEDPEQEVPQEFHGIFNINQKVTIRSKKG